MQGTVSNLLQKLNDQKLLSDQANELLEAFSDIPLELVRLNRGAYFNVFGLIISGAGD